MPGGQVLCPNRPPPHEKLFGSYTENEWRESTQSIPVHTVHIVQC